MAELLNPRTPVTEKQIENLRQIIRALDRDQNRAMEFAAYITMSKKETQDFEDRGKRLSDLRRELLYLIQSQR